MQWHIDERGFKQCACEFFALLIVGYCRTQPSEERAALIEQSSDGQALSLARQIGGRDQTFDIFHPLQWIGSSDMYDFLSNNSMEWFDNYVSGLCEFISVNHNVFAEGIQNSASFGYTAISKSFE